MQAEQLAIQMKIFEDPVDTSKVERGWRWMRQDVPTNDDIEIKNVYLTEDQGILSSGYRVTTRDGQIADFPRSSDNEISAYRQTVLWAILWNELGGLPLVDNLSFFPKKIVSQTKPYRVVYATLVPTATINEVTELFDVTKRTVRQYYLRVP